jgi:hypothetical protein
VAGLHRIATNASLAVVAVWAAGCNGDIVDPDVCGDLAPPEAPTIVSLGPRANFVVPGEVVIDVSPLVDADGDPFHQLEVEIWTRNDDGSARERVWLAVVADPTVRTVRLSDGVYEGLGAFLGGLEQWRDYLVRARYVVDADGGECTSEGAWSAKRDFRTDDGSSAIYDQSIVRDYWIGLPPESVASINAEAIPPGCVPYERNYYTGTFNDGSMLLAGVGVKAKGGCGSARDLDGKTALKVHLGWDDPQVAGCPADRRVKGIERFTFNNMVQDGSMAHEQLAYALYEKMGVPVPRIAYARITVNGTFYGIYNNIETVDRRFLARHFNSNRGALYEGTYWCDLVAGNIHDDDSGCLTRSYAPDPCDTPSAGDDPLDYAPLRDFVAKLDALPATGVYPALAQFLDVDEWMSMWAVDMVLAHWDGYEWNLRNNYRVYHDPASGLWSMIPSGVDQTMQIQHVNDTLFGVQGRIATMCLADQQCSVAFAVKVRQAVAAFQDLNMGSRRQALQDRLGTLVMPDPGREYDAADTANDHNTTQQFIDQRPTVVLNALAARGL